LGSFPAPAFMFLAGLSAALGYGRIERDPRPAPARLWLSLRRGLEILGLALLFRLQEFVQWTSWSCWRDFFKVDILNTIGVSLMLLGLLFWAVRRELARIVLLAALVLLTGLLTPAVWSWPFLADLPWALRNYLTGSFTPGIFPLFPWFGFAPAGAIAGLLIVRHRADRAGMAKLSAVMIGAGAVLFLAGRWAVGHAAHPADWSFWHNSPEYFFIRAGILCATLGACYFLCLPFDPGRFSWMRLFGRHSLLVYWVHIDLVYGRLFGFLKGTMGPVPAVIGFVVLSAAMLLLAWAVEHWRKIRERCAPGR
ncbi:MAG TPA: heparan-alpha-glucosaminide N-acetyltransferase domain-containing protein, partial [Candidatus Edwardsbacteria bacterium]|nr:heparan-alpha-glucosaminide N-acetyltransferase domain-containing protein [Candidatus Edwardsbacteria bacterium]